MSSRRIHAQMDKLAKYDFSSLEQFDWPEEGFLSNLIFWAAENQVALCHARESNVLVVHYEHLCMDPRNEMRRVEDHLGVRFPDTLHERFDEVSWSSRQEIGSMSVEEKISRWRTRINDENLSYLVAVLAACGLADVYGADPLPLHAPLAPAR